MSTSAYAGVVKWSGRDEWRERFDLLLGDHLDATRDHLGVETQEELAELIGDDRFALAYSAAFEDLLSWVWDDGSNLANDYLKRRGFKETATTRDRLAAYPGSVRSIWRVAELRDDGQVLVEDLIRDSEPQWIEAALVGPVTLQDGDIVLIALSPERAERGLALLSPVLEGLVGEPLVTADAAPPGSD